MASPLLSMGHEEIRAPAAVLVLFFKPQEGWGGRLTTFSYFLFSSVSMYHIMSSYSSYLPVPGASFQAARDATRKEESKKPRCSGQTT